MPFSSDKDQQAGPDVCECTSAPASNSEQQPASYIQRISECVRRFAVDATTWDEEMRNREGWVGTL